MNRVPTAISLAIAVLVGAALISGCGQKQTSIDFSDCANLGPAQASNCISRIVTERLRQNPQPSKLFIEIDRVANNSDPQISALCHGAMHLSGRRFARDNKVTLDNLQDYLPQSDGPNCSDGFAHGLFMAIKVDPQRAEKALATCAQRPTRTRQYACVHGIGHAFRRGFIGDTNLNQTLAACSRLGPTVDLECAAGAYHDYFLAAAGKEDTPRPQGPAVTEFCKDQKATFLTQCWYRLFQGLKINNPPSKAPYIRYLCGGRLKGSNHSACVTGASEKLITTNDLVSECSQMPKADALACLLGARQLSWSSLVSADYVGDNKQANLDQRANDFRALIGQCSRLAALAASCIDLMATRSIRALPDRISRAEGNRVCSGLQGGSEKICRHAIAQASVEFLGSGQ